ncbi:hypothetical protein MNBD_GAMMA11-3426 [hydrothermal vent metagenome]|uniref:Outer membrane protein beta-barrel domain-containing protein n=1 Tax=hydrothermal vent metagenome TaxID=652676 RepID=A0A3B0YD74_9ZZZZ
MKKYIVLVFMAIIAPVSQAESFFDNTVIGLAFINQSVEIEVSGAGADTRLSESGSGFGLYIDKYYDRIWRINGTLSYVNYNSFDIAEVIFSTDYLLPVSENLSFFSGVALGAATQRYSNSGVADSALGAVYGVQAGAILYINKFLMLEAGYRFRPTQLETEVTTMPGELSTVIDLSESYFSLLFMF